MRIRPWQPSLVALILAAAQAPRATPFTASSSRPWPPTAHPSFAVATIKPHDPNYPRRQGWNFGGDRVSIQNQSVATMLMFAYSIDHLSRLADAPGLGIARPLGSSRAPPTQARRASSAFTRCRR